MSTIVLITGANRGLGKGMLERYLKLPNHTLIAANRNPDHPSSKELSKLPTAEGTKLIVIKIDAKVWQDPFDAVKTLEAQGIDHVDVVIANAGVSYTWPKVAEVKLEDIEAHMWPNAYGGVALYQAFRPLLKKSKKEPVLTNMGSTAGSLNSPLPFPNAAYGPSKSVSAWFTIKIHMEDDWLNSFSLGPGWVHTDLGDAGAIGLGADEDTQAKFMISCDDSCDGMFKVVTETSREKHGGKLVLFNGDVTPW
ncbi:Uu.00g024520.m01.CDS01 [Anthostomella pinea]|uniref:Uu.00g024520.m01.CDS01 n=1 Tax=Anthostomella pinea TaxID=933095 RepID=A0AAI8W0A9_9PEZI|nr:Uu.00g024520.m01.CDS01 [Anthostomella pinea]